MRERKLFRKAVLGTIQQKKVVKWRINESSFNKASHKKWCILALHADDCCLECYWKPGYSTEHNAYIIWYCWQLEITGKYRLVSQRLTTYLTFAKPCWGNKSAKSSTGKYPGIWWMSAWYWLHHSMSIYCSIRSWGYDHKNFFYLKELKAVL